MGRASFAVLLGFLLFISGPVARAADSYSYSPGVLLHWADLHDHTGSDPVAVCKTPSHRWQGDGKLEYLYINGSSEYHTYFVYYCYNGADYTTPVTSIYECPADYLRDLAYDIRDAKACKKLLPPQVDPDQQPGPPDEDMPSNDDGGGGSCGADDDGVVGDPVNTANGNKFESVTDYRASGASPLRLIRFYDSQMTRDGSMGSHWRHYYDRQLVLLSPTAAKAWRPDGKGIPFTLNNGQWTAPGNSMLRLQSYADSSGQIQGWRLTTGRDAIEVYDASGRLIQMTERPGLNQSLAYDGNGLLQSVTDNFGRALAFAYDAQGRVIQVTSPANAAYHYSYDSNGNLALARDPDSRQLTYLYENAAYPHALTGVLDGNGSRIDSTRYGTEGKVVYNERGSNINPLTINYDDSSANVADSYGSSRVFTFGLIQGVMKTTGLSRTCPSCGAAARHYDRDVNGNITRRVDFNGITTTYQYDTSRNLETGRTEAVGTAQERTINTDWHASFRLPVRITEPGRVTEMVYDDSGNMTSLLVRDTASNEQRQWHYQYGSYGLLQSATQPGGEVLSYVYDGYGNLTSVTSSLGLVTRYDNYDANGRPARITYPGGRSLDLTYDAAGHVLTRTEHVEVPSSSDGVMAWLRSVLSWLWQFLNRGMPMPAALHDSAGSALYRYTYDAAGQLREVKTPDNANWHYDYDTAYRLVQRTDPVGHLTQVLRDPAGNITGLDTYEGSTLLEKHRYSYDVYGRLQQIKGNQGQQTSLVYDDEGALLSQTDMLGNATQRSHDALYRTSLTTDALGQSTRLGYNALDQLLTVTDARGNVTAYTPNAFGETTAELSPDRGALQRVYTQGHLITETDARGIPHQYSYDADGRVTTVTAPHGNVQYHYDQGSYGAGRLTGIDDPSGSTGYRYNSLGQVVEKVSTVRNGATLRLRYTYTLGGQPQEVLTPGGHLVRYDRDANGQVTRVSVDNRTLLSQVRWGTGDMAGWTWGSGMVRSEQRDLDGRLTGLVSGKALQRQYGYDLANRLVSMNDAKSGAQESYGYDATGRLLTQQVGGGQNSYGYDATGNRQQWLSRTGTVTTTTQYQTAVASNRLMAEQRSGANRAYTYLASGQISSDGQYRYSYNDEGRLTDVLSANGQSTVQHAVYNALGQRVLKQGRGTLVFAYDESGHVLGEYAPGGVMVREYVWLGDRLVGMLSADVPGALLQVHVDHLGTPRAVSQGDTVLWRWEGEAFGSSLPNETVAGSSRRLTMPLRFPGQYYDSETALHYNYFRDYNPKTGRYGESDPIGLKGGPNTYAYVGSDPISSIDYYGRETDVVINNNSFSEVWSPIAGTHAGVYITNGGDSILYDPGGSFASSHGGGGGDFIETQSSTLTDYIKYQLGDGPDVDVYRFNTTKEEEAQILDNIMDGGNYGPGQCATGVSNALRGVGPFKDLGMHGTPRGLGNALKSLPGANK